MPSYRLGFLGAGNMAEAIARGVRNAEKILPAKNIRAADPNPDRRRLFTDELRIVAGDDNADLVRHSDLVILAVKPQVLDQVLAAVGPLLGPDKLTVSIVAGVTIARIAKFCPPGARIIRTMPNTPLLVGRGLVALSPGATATAADLDRARQLFAACAATIELPEEKMDAVTALSGSGPAYFFYLVEALTQAGIAAGLAPDEAALLAQATFTGAAELLAHAAAQADALQILEKAKIRLHDAKSRGHMPSRNLPDASPTALANIAADLRRRVTSPGGTTAAAIASFDHDKFFDIVTRAVRAAAARSRELGK